MYKVTSFESWKKLLEEIKKEENNKGMKGEQTFYNYRVCRISDLFDF